MYIFRLYCNKCKFAGIFALNVHLYVLLPQMYIYWPNCHICNFLGYLATNVHLKASLLQLYWWIIGLWPNTIVENTLWIKFERFPWCQNPFYLLAFYVHQPNPVDQETWSRMLLNYQVFARVKHVLSLFGIFITMDSGGSYCVIWWDCELIVYQSIIIKL